MMLTYMKLNLMSGLHTVRKIPNSYMSFMHKIKVVYLMMFLYTMSITLSQLTQSIIMHTHNKQNL